MKKLTLFVSTLLASVLAKAQIIALENGQYAIKSTKAQIAGEGTGTCLADKNVAGDGTGTCLADSKMVTFDHPKFLTSKQIVALLKQASQDNEREQILELLKNDLSN